MSRRRWHILRSDDALTVARSLPPVFDVVADTRLPNAGRARVAHQVRQDMWRALQNVRGFSPVVQVLRDADGLLVRAGGRVARPFDASTLSARIASVLDDPEKRARWVRHAGGRS